MYQKHAVRLRVRSNTDVTQLPKKKGKRLQRKKPFVCAIMQRNTRAKLERTERHQLDYYCKDLVNLSVSLRLGTP